MCQTLILPKPTLWLILISDIDCHLSKGFVDCRQREQRLKRIQTHYFIRYTVGLCWNSTPGKPLSFRSALSNATKRKQMSEAALLHTWNFHHVCNIYGIVFVEPSKDRNIKWQDKRADLHASASHPKNLNYSCTI